MGVFDVKVFNGDVDVTEEGVRGVRNGAKRNFQAKFRLTSCPEDPLLWDKENHFRLNATEGQECISVYVFFVPALVISSMLKDRSVGMIQRYIEEDNLEFKGKDKNIELMESEGGHLLA